MRFAPWRPDSELVTTMKKARARRLGALIIAALEGGIILSHSQRSPQPLRDVAEEMGILLSCES